MLRIRLTRTGKKNQPSYRVVVAEQHSKRDGRYLANIGLYNPLTKPATIIIDQKAYQHWSKRGAQPTDTVRKLYNQLYKKQSQDQKTAKSQKSTPQAK